MISKKATCQFVFVEVCHFTQGNMAAGWNGLSTNMYTDNVNVWNFKKYYSTHTITRNDQAVIDMTLFL